MNRLFRLRKPLSEMTRDELREDIRRIRMERRISKDKPSKKVKQKKQSDKAKTKVTGMLAKLSSEDISKLLGELDDADHGSKGSTT